MKKFLTSFFVLLLVLILAAGAYLFYQRSRTAKYLEEFSKNQTYLGMGFSVELFPGSAKVQGWMKPSLTLDRATVSLVSFQSVPPESLVGARLEVDLFKPGALRLIAPKFNVGNEEGSVDGLYFILKSDKTISEVGIDTVVVKEKKNPDETTILRQVRYEMGPWVGFIPDKAVGSIQKIEFTKVDKVQATLDPMQVSVESQKQGNGRHWKVSFLGKGGSVHGEGEVEASLKPWQFTVEGSAQDVPKETMFNFIKDFSAKVSALIKAPESQPESQADSIPSFIPGPMPEFQKFMEPYQQLVTFLTSLGVQAETSQMSWGGLSVKILKEGVEVEVLPSSGKGTFTYQPDSFKGESSLTLDGVKVKTKDSNYDLKGLGLSYQGEYHISYANLMKDFLGYYKNLMVETLQNPMAYNPFNYIASAYAYYPDAAVYEMKLASFNYSTPKVSGDHSNLVLGFKAESQSIGYYLSGNFNEKFSQDPTFDIKDGKFDLNFKNILPWEKYLKVARAFASGESPTLNIAEAFNGERGGLDWKIDANGGPNWFAAKLSLNLMDELGKYFQIFQQSMTPKAGEDMNEMKKNTAQNMIKEFLTKGSLDVSLNLERFSRFQAMIDKMEPGSSAGLMVISPYVVMDAKADTLSANLTLKDGKVLLNGKPNAQIDQAMQMLH